MLTKNNFREIWIDAEKTGNVVSLIGRPKYGTPEYEYDANICLIEGGVCPEDFKERSLALARHHGFPEEPIHRAFQVGIRKAYSQSLEGLRARFESGAVGGIDPDYTEKKLRCMAEKYGFSSNELEEVMKLRDPKKEAAIHLAAGEFGFEDNMRVAREIVAANGFLLNEEQQHKFKYLGELSTLEGV